MRKIYFLTISVLCIAAVSNAQISKGSTFLGGSVSFSENQSEDENNSQYKNKNSAFTIRPQFGKAISTNKVIGLFLNYSYSNYKQNQMSTETIDKFNGYGGGVFLRNYYPLNSRFYLFGEANLGVNFSERERSQNSILSSKENTTGLRLAISPGISFAAGKKLHLETTLNDLFAIGYSASKTKYYNNSGAVGGSSKSNSFGASANANGFNQISVGLRWILPSKKDS